MNKFIVTYLFLLLSASTFSSEISVLFVKGTAYVTDESTQKRLNKGDVINEGESIETKKNSFLILKISEHSKHKIDPETIVQIESLPYKFEGGEEIEQPAQIYLKVGTIMSEIFEKSDNESAIVRTNSTSMGVRGTKFLVNQNDSDVLLSVEEGVVEIKNNNQADIVEANQSVVVENDKVFTAVRPYKFQKQINWSFREDTLRSFNEVRAAYKSEFLKKRRPWKRDQLRWQNFKKERKTRLEHYQNEVKDLTKNKKLKVKMKQIQKRLMERAVLKDKKDLIDHNRPKETIKRQLLERPALNKDLKREAWKRRRQIRRENHDKPSGKNTATDHQQ
ncbi:MAG: hypothetical protein CME64_09990 [Halobacteriovoraceae bacterium]|nr:hypothetical protein [Halobacteriovoraceae bacterium]|tara:strand:+ start:87305 stop:88306 length:1002 start_codon:yes stop_codon:yes gene_type:complete